MSPTSPRRLSTPYREPGEIPAYSVLSQGPASQPGELPGGDLDTLPDSLSRDGSFAADLPADLAAFMADAQVPWSVGALGGAVTDPAWRAKPS